MQNRHVTRQLNPAAEHREVSMTDLLQIFSNNKDAVKQINSVSPKDDAIVGQLFSRED